MPLVVDYSALHQGAFVGFPAISYQSFSELLPRMVTSAELVYERAPCDLFCILGG
jgi:hypothetical protein